MTRMYSRNGGQDVAHIDAMAACRNFPREWTLEPWKRPDGRPDVFIPPAWDTTIFGTALIDLARTTVREGAKVDDVEQATIAISEYLAGTTHPTEKVSK